MERFVKARCGGDRLGEGGLIEVHTRGRFFRLPRCRNRCGLAFAQSTCHPTVPLCRPHRRDPPDAMHSTLFLLCPPASPRSPALPGALPLSPPSPQAGLIHIDTGCMDEVFFASKPASGAAVLLVPGLVAKRA